MHETSRIIVHVGAPKCGSSALQVALCRSPVFSDSRARSHVYGFIDATGRLTSGAAARRKSALSSMGARASQNISTADEARRLLGRAEPALARLMAQGEVPVLSCEGWIRAAAHFTEADTLARLGGGAHVMVFVRPPCDWMNSAWWQWGVWSGTDLDSFVRRNILNVRWPALIRAWSEVPGVDKITVALAEDVTTRFFRLLDATPPPPVLANAGVPPALLLFLLRNRRFRPDPHSARTEFIVAQHLATRKWPAPWVLAPEHVSRIMAAVENLPRKMARWLSPEDSARVNADSHWSSAAAYEARKIEDLGRHAAPDALAALCGLLAEGRGQDPATAEAACRAAMAAATDPVAAADHIVAKHVDAMIRGFTRRAAGGAATEAVRALLQR